MIIDLVADYNYSEDKRIHWWQSYYHDKSAGKQTSLLLAVSKEFLDCELTADPSHVELVDWFEKARGEWEEAQASDIFLEPYHFVAYANDASGEENLLAFLRNQAV